MGFRFLEELGVFVAKLLELPSTHAPELALKTFGAQESPLAQDDGTCGLMQRMGNVIGAILLRGSERKPYEDMLVEFLEDTDRAFEVLILAVFFVADIESKTAPPNISLTEFWDGSSCFQNSLFRIPRTEVLHYVLQYQTMVLCVERLREMKCA